MNLGAQAMFWAFYSLTLYRALGFWRGLAAQWRIAEVMVLCWGMAPLLATAPVQGTSSSDATVFFLWITQTPKRAATTDDASSSRAAHSVPVASDSTIPSVPGGIQAPPPAAAVEPAATTMATATAVALVVAGEGTSADGATLPPHPHREDSATATAGTGGAACRTLSDDTQTTATAVDDDDVGGVASASSTSAAAGALAAGASYWMIQLSPLPLVEAAMARWSAFAAAAPIHEDFMTSALWLSAVVVLFCTGSAVGLGWNSAGALAGMARGLASGGRRRRGHPPRPPSGRRGRRCRRGRGGGQGDAPRAGGRGGGVSATAAFRGGCAPAPPARRASSLGTPLFCTPAPPPPPSVRLTNLVLLVCLRCRPSSSPALVNPPPRATPRMMVAALLVRRSGWWTAWRFLTNGDTTCFCDAPVGFPVGADRMSPGPASHLRTAPCCTQGLVPCKNDLSQRTSLLPGPPPLSSL